MSYFPKGSSIPHDRFTTGSKDRWIGIQVQKQLAKDLERAPQSTVEVKSIQDDVAAQTNNTIDNQ